jgi:hypothetical protein
MTTRPSNLDRFRAELRDAIEADLTRRAARRRTARSAARLGVPGMLAAALGIALALVLSAGPGVRPADAAILAAARSALTPPAGTILHERFLVSVGNSPSEVHESWFEESAPGAYRVIKPGIEFSWNGTATSVYDQASNSIYNAPESSRSPGDLAALLRSLIASGKARVTGTTTVNGVPARTLAISGLPSGWASGAANGTYDIASGDARPLLVQTTTDCGRVQCPETIQFQVYEYLPATPANLALLSVAAQHPGAMTVPAPTEPGASQAQTQKAGRG